MLEVLDPTPFQPVFESGEANVDEPAIKIVIPFGEGMGVVMDEAPVLSPLSSQEIYTLTGPQGNKDLDDPQKD